MDAAHKFLICKGSSGMGNRILAACTAILYSQISGRKLIIDWRDGSYSEEGDNSFPVFFELPEANSMEELPVAASVYPPVWQDKLETSLGRLRQALEVSDRSLSFELDQLDYEQDILVFCAYKLIRT
ncbi:MAG: nodulation protein NodZ [Prochlorotrichaceae cyanobacterium]